ncbi:MAG: hypothetical protein V8S42_08610 [Lachnospiraceae bacterium]
MVNRLEAAKARVDECQKNVDALTLQSTKDTNNATVNTKPDELNRIRQPPIWQVHRNALKGIRQRRLQS